MKQMVIDAEKIFLSISPTKTKLKGQNVEVTCKQNAVVCEKSFWRILKVSTVEQNQRQDCLLTNH